MPFTSAVFFVHKTIVLTHSDEEFVCFVSLSSALHDI